MPALALSKHPIHRLVSNTMFNHTRPTIRTASTRIAQSTAAAIAFVLLALPAAHAQQQEPAKTIQTADTSRAEIIADLALWRRAGVDRYAYANSYSLDNEAYQAAYQHYLRLRNSDEFQIEIQKALQQ